MWTRCCPNRHRSVRPMCCCAKARTAIATTPTIKEAEEELLRYVTDICVTNKGKLIIPAFSIGKTQEVLYT